MSLRVSFHGGPADGCAQDYPHIGTPLPSLWWPADPPDHDGAVYRLVGSDPDTGRWTYEFDPR